MRLLPGDVAPVLELEKFLNHEGTRPIIFDRPSFVTLWNAGCSGCLPAIAELADFSAPHSLQCIGVAVMVRDVEATETAALGAESRAVLALEDRPQPLSVLGRGAVTRNWLEASGRDAVPTTFIVNGGGLLAWIGTPDHAPRVMTAILDGTWDLKEARASELSAAADAPDRRIAIMDVTEAMMTGQLHEAATIIRDAEQRVSGLGNEPQFATLKLQVLASLDEDAAARYYVQAAPMFKGDAAVQTTLAITALTGLRKPRAVAEAAVESLGLVVGGNADLPPDLRAISAVLLGRAKALVGDTAAALAILDLVNGQMESGAVPERASKWCRAQAELIAADLHGIKTG